MRILISFSWISPIVNGYNVSLKVILRQFITFFIIGRILPVEKEREQFFGDDNAPAYLAQHTVLPAYWSYLLPFHDRAHSINFLTLPPYKSVANKLNSSGNENQEICLTGGSNKNQVIDSSNSADSEKSQNKLPFVSNASMDLDIHSVMATELLEEAKDSGMSDSSGGGSNHCDRSNGLNTNAFMEAKNVEVLRRVHEMQRMVENSEQYLNEQGENAPECDVRHLASVNKNFYDSISSWQNDQSRNKAGTTEFDSDCDSLTSSKVSSIEDTPNPGVLKHSDSLVLLAEAINQDLNGITQSLNSIGGKQLEPSDNILSISTTCSPRFDRKFNNIGQILSNLQSSDFSQSESDSESVNSPTNSPTARRPALLCAAEGSSHKQNLSHRCSFGLHSPDGNNFGPDNKDYNLKEYLKQLKEISSAHDGNHDTDIAAKKLSEIYGFEIREDTFIETDADLIDLRSIPPPRTPDELDSISLLNAAPQGFDDGSKKASITDVGGDLDTFIANIVVAPPTQKATPAKELTPEEIMSFIIPPPPTLEDPENLKKYDKVADQTESLYSNSVSETRKLFNNTANLRPANIQPNQKETKELVMGRSEHVIEYSTVERKSKFSCCPKSTKDESDTSVSVRTKPALKVPPRSQSIDKPLPPERPPKSAELIQRFSPKKRQSTAAVTQNQDQNVQKPAQFLREEKPPSLPPRLKTSPRTEERASSPSVSELPQKPPLPPIVNRSIPRNIPLNATNLKSESCTPLSGVTQASCISSQSSPSANHISNFQPKHNTVFSPNGRQIINNDYASSFLQTSITDNLPSLPLHCSPQMTRKTLGPVSVPLSSNITPKIGEKYIIKNGHIIDSEALLAKTDIAMAGLLIKLDQVAAQCSAAQLAGGGISIDEDKFQRARNELTEQTLALVTASKFLVVAMSDMTLSTLPEHLTSCLTALRRITELTQDITRHTSSPLQTRNIVLKVHDVASSFRELVGVQIGPLGAGQLALQAECLANVLATLLRSLRVFSP